MSPPEGTRHNQVMSFPSLRGAYDAVEREVAPRIEALVRTRQFAQASAWIAQARAAAGGRLDAVNARLLHAVNLPAGTDIKRLQRQTGELDREVRRLTLELAARDEQRKEARGDAGTARSARRPGPGSP